MDGELPELPARRTVYRHGGDFDIERTIDLLAEYVNTKFEEPVWSGNRERRVQKAKDFALMLDAIGKRLATQPKETERLMESYGEGLQRRLLNIALDRHKNKHLYDGFWDLYWTNAVRSSRSGRIRHPREEHCTEEYRYLWEYYLLSPRTFVLDKLAEPARNALRKIRNPHSIVVLTTLFKSALKGHEALNHVLVTLGYFHSKEALIAMLGCIADATKAVSKKQLSQKELARVQETFFQTITFQPVEADVPPWQEIVVAYLARDDCPDNHRRLLEQIAKHFEQSHDKM
jgi:hypothetical protein